MSIITCGFNANGTEGDYTTGAALAAAVGVNADLPTTLTEIVYIQILYADADQGNFFDETFDFPAVVTTGFHIEFVGMYGSHTDRTCPIIKTLDCTSATDNKSDYIYRNLAFGDDASTKAINVEKWEIEGRFIECNILGYYYNNYGQVFFVDSFIFATTTGYTVYAGNLVFVGTIVSNTTATNALMRAQYTYKFKNSIFCCPNGSITQYYAAVDAKNSIIYSDDLDSTSYHYSPVNNMTYGYNNCCVWQLGFEGKWSRDNTMLQEFGVDLDVVAKDSIVANPDFLNASGNFNLVSDFALDTDSLCLPENRSIVSNELFPDNDRQYDIIGPYSNYTAPDFADAANVLTIDTTNGVQGTFNEAARNIDPGEANVKGSTTYKILNANKTGSYVLSSTPGDPPVVTAATPGDGQVTFALTADEETDDLYCRYRAFPGGTWSAESETFKRTGSGNLTINTLTNESRYEFIFYGNNEAGLDSAWTTPEIETPTDGSAPVFDQLVDAVAAMVTDLSLTTANSTAFTIDTTYPPKWDTKDTPTIFVIPDGSTPKKLSGMIETSFVVGVIVCEHVENDSQLANRDGVINAIQAEILGTPRPITGVWIDAEPLSEARPFDPEEIKQFKIISAFNINYKHRKN